MQEKHINVQQKLMSVQPVCFFYTCTNFETTIHTSGQPVCPISVRMNCYFDSAGTFILTVIRTYSPSYFTVFV